MSGKQRNNDSHPVEPTGEKKHLCQSLEVTSAPTVCNSVIIQSESNRMLKIKNYRLGKPVL